MVPALGMSCLEPWLTYPYLSLRVCLCKIRITKPSPEVMRDPEGSCPRGGRHARPSVNPQYMKMFALILRKQSEHTGPNSLWQAGPVPTGRERLAGANPKAKLRALVCAPLLSNKSNT